MNFGFGTPFYEQLAFFRQKLNLPSERWDDIKRAAHDRAFIVAGAQKADLLNDLNGAVTKAIRDGKGLADFRKDFKSIVAKHGWTGWTGEGTAAGEAWRTKVIYQTNMATSYAAGRYQQLTDPEFLTLRPYWRYKHADWVANPRLQHVAWNDLTLPHDHPFWQTHFAPNGWGCHCRVTPVGAREYEKSKAAGKAVPPAGWDEIDAKTGAPKGIAKGFDYAPGASVRGQIKALVADKLTKLEAPIGSAMFGAVQPVIEQEVAAGFSTWVDDVLAAGQSRGQYAVVGAMTEVEIGYYSAAVGATPATAEIAIEDRLLVGKKATRHEAAGTALTPDEWKSIPDALISQRKAYFDKQEQKVIYILPSLSGDRSVKLAVQVDFVTGRPKQTVNAVRAGYKINAQALEDRARYEAIE